MRNKFLCKIVRPRKRINNTKYRINQNKNVSNVCALYTPPPPKKEPFAKSRFHFSHFTFSPLVCCSWWKLLFPFIFAKKKKWYFSATFAPFPYFVYSCFYYTFVWVACDRVSYLFVYLIFACKTTLRNLTSHTKKNIFSPLPFMWHLCCYILERNE